MRSTKNVVVAGLIAVIVVVAGIVVLNTTSSSESASGPLRIAYNTWVGFGPLFVAQEKGFFGEDGLDVELRLMEGTAEKGSALAAGSIDGAATTADAFVIQAAKGVPGTVVMGFDESMGADGIVATKDIESISDLKGKTIALEEGFVGHFFLLYLLDEVGLSTSDITITPMSTGDAGAAFVAGRVDAAVTWEPWLSKAKERENGHVLVTSADKPGLIADVLVVHDDVLKTRRDDVLKFMRAWYRAVEFHNTNPDESTAIIAKALKLTAQDAKDMLTGLRFLDHDSNLTYFGTNSAPGKVRQVLDKASGVWLKQGLMSKPVDAKNIVDSTLVREVK